MPDWGNAASVQRWLDELERKEQERVTGLKLWRQGERTADEPRPMRSGQDSPYAVQMQSKRDNSASYADQVRQRMIEQQRRAGYDGGGGLEPTGNAADWEEARRDRQRPDQLWRDAAPQLPVQQVRGPVGQSGLGEATPVQGGAMMRAPTVTAPAPPLAPEIERWKPTWERWRSGDGSQGEADDDVTPDQPEAMGGGALWDKWIGGAVDWWRDSAAGQAFAQRQDALINPERQAGYVASSELPSVRSPAGWQQYGLMMQQAPRTRQMAASWLREQAQEQEQPDWVRSVAGVLAPALESSSEAMRQPILLPFEYLPAVALLLGALWSKGADRLDDMPVGKGALVAGGTVINSFQAGDDTMKLLPLPGRPEYTAGQFLSGIGRAIWQNPLLLADPFLGGRQLHEAKMRWMNAYSKAAGGQPSVNGSPGQWALLNVYGSPETVKKTYDDLMLYQNRAGVIANYQQQAQQAQANGDALQAAQLGAEAAWWKNARPVDIVDRHTELLPEVAFTMLFDWTNLIGMGFDLAKLGPQTRRMAQAMKSATQSDGTVLKALDEAVATTRALQDANGNSLLAAHNAGAAAQAIGLTNEARATTDAANLFTFFTQLLGDVKRSDDARLLVEAAATMPRELITGLQGLGGLGAEVLQADGTFRVGAGLFSTRVIEAVPTLMEARATLMNLPSLQAETFNPMHALAEIHDALFASAYRVHGLADWAMPQGTKSVRVAAGEVSVAAQAGAERAPAAVLEYVDEGGNVISRSKPMGAAEATGEANQLNQWIATGRTEAPEYSALRAPDRLMRGFMSSVFLNLMPGHWVRNAASGVGHLVTDGVMTFEPTSKLVGEVANQFGGVLPLTWMRDAFQGTADEAAAASARAMGAPEKGSFWDFLGKDNLLSRLDAAGSRAWTGGASVAGGRVPTGEMNMRLRGFAVPFRRGLREEWGKVAQRQLEPMLTAMGMERKQAKRLISTVVDAAVMGNKREILPAVRRFLDGTASTVDMNALGLANGSISPDAYRTIRQVLDVYATNGDRAAAERAINEALDAEQLLFAQILADAPAQPGRQAFTQLENVQDYAELLRDVEHAAKKAGADPEQATAPIKEMIAQFGQAEQQGYQALLAAAAETPTPQVRALLFDAWAQVYDAKIAARQRQGELARAAMEDPARWVAYPQEVARVWGEFFTTQERLFAEALGLMPEAAAGRYVSTAPAGSHGLLEKLASIDIDQARAQMGRTPTGLADPEYQQIIDAGRAFQDQAASTMYTMALRYADDIDAFDHVISAELDVRRMAAAAASARAEIAAKYPDLRVAAARKQYYKEMSEMWGDFWFATSARYHAASMEIATDFVMRRLAPDASFVEPWADPFGRTLTLLEPVETEQGRRWRVLDMDKRAVADDLIPDAQVPAEAKSAWEQAMRGPQVRVQAQQMVEQVHQSMSKPTTLPEQSVEELRAEAERLSQYVDDLIEEQSMINALVGVPVELKALWARLRKAMNDGPATRVEGRPKFNFGGLRDAGPADLFDVMQRTDRRVGAAGNLRQPTVGDAAAFRVEDIEQLRRRLLQELDQVGQAPMSLTNQQKLQVLGAVQGMLPQYDNVLAGVTKGAQAISDFAMLDYSKVHGFDTALALQTPYHFWFTRSAKNWLERSLLKPSVLASYLRIKRAIDEQNERERMPQRMGGTVGVPGTQVRIGNPYNLLIPYQTLYELNEFDEPVQNPNVLQRYVETARTLGFGLNPLYDSIYKAASGRGQEIQAGDFVPQYRLINYVYKALTGRDLPGAGDEYDPYRDARTLARMVQAGQIDEQTARWLMDRLMQRAQGVAALPEEAAAERQAWDGIMQQAARESGFERLAPLLSRSFAGVSAYQMPGDELAIRQMQEARRGLGYGPGNAFGSQAAVDAFDEQSGYDQVQGAWMGKDALIPQGGGGQPVPPTYPYQQPYQPTRPGVAAVDAEKKAAKAALQQEMDAAVTAALEANPNMKPAELKAIKQPYRDAIDELDAQYPSATDWAGQGPRDFYGNMNPEELLQSAQQGIVYQALDELARMQPGEGASAAEWDAYNAALEARVGELMGDAQALSGQVYGRPVDVAPNSTLPPRINGEIPAPYSPVVAGAATTAMPGAAASAPTATPARALIDQVLGGNSTPAESAYWDRRDAQFAANEAMWAQRKAAVYATFGQSVGEMYEGYLALPSGSQARKEYKAAHPELRAVSLFAYHPQEYGQLQEMFGADGIMAWAKLPPATDRKARSAYYDANPAAFLVQAWVYGRPGKQDEQDTAADEAFQYNFGADFATAVEMFGPDIWRVVALYRRGWDKATKSAYYRQNAQLSPFFDWWYGNLEDRANTAPFVAAGRGGGWGGGGWGGGGGGGGYVRMPQIDPRWMDRSLQVEERDIRRWRPQESNMADLSWLQAGSQLRPRPIQRWRRERLW